MCFAEEDSSLTARRASTICSCHEASIEPAGQDLAGHAARDLAGHAAQVLADIAARS